MGFLSLSSLKSQVSKPYFPVVIFALATANTFAAVSYTHLTLPTILRV